VCVCVCVCKGLVSRGVGGEGGAKGISIMRISSASVVQRPGYANAPGKRE
jgi:hypothetical protein